MLLATCLPSNSIYQSQKTGVNESLSCQVVHIKSSVSNESQGLGAYLELCSMLRRRSCEAMKLLLRTLRRKKATHWTFCSSKTYLQENTWCPIPAHPNVELFSHAVSLSVIYGLHSPRIKSKSPLCSPILRVYCESFIWIHEPSGDWSVDNMGWHCTNMLILWHFQDLRDVMNQIN